MRSSLTHTSTGRLARAAKPALKGVAYFAPSRSERLYLDKVNGRADEDEAIRAQHGPVRILVKDGKPVAQDEHL
jgi:hypothetical protein